MFAIILAASVAFLLVDVALWCFFVRMNDSLILHVFPGSGFYFLYRHLAGK